MDNCFANWIRTISHSLQSQSAHSRAFVSSSTQNSFIRDQVRAEDYHSVNQQECWSTDEDFFIHHLADSSSWMKHKTTTTAGRTRRPPRTKERFVLLSLVVVEKGASKALSLIHLFRNVWMWRDRNGNSCPRSVCRLHHFIVPMQQY